MIATLLCLVGEQPIPNLLPVLHLKPQRVLLVVTQHPSSRRIAAALQDVLGEFGISTIECSLTKEYSIAQTQAELEYFLAHHGISLTHINVTGGTKAMALAAFLLAQSRHLPVYYLESNQRTSNQLYCTNFGGGTTQEVSIDTISQEIALDLFIRSFGYPLAFAHPRDALEKAVLRTIATGNWFEIRTGVEVDSAKNTDIDIMLRHKDRYAVIEVKCIAWENCTSCGKKVKPKPKQALEQIVTISEQRVFGTYTIRILVLHCSQSDIKNLDGIMDMAQILNTRPILIHEPYDMNGLSAQDAERVRDGLFAAFGISHQGST